MDENVLVIFLGGRGVGYQPNLFSSNATIALTGAYKGEGDQSIQLEM